MAFKFVCLALALSLAPTAVLGQKLRTLTKPACNGPNERLIATGGGCYVDTNGVQQCAPSPPPRCECALGFERNSATQKCEAAPGASLRSVRDTASQDPPCNGPHEMLFISKGCPIDANGNRDCSKKIPNQCGCEPGYKRDDATKKCVTDPAAAGSIRTTRNLKEKLPECGENEHIFNVIGGCSINAQGQHDCSQRVPSFCVCNSGFIRNAATKKCDVPSLGAAPGAAPAPGDSKDKLPDCGENASILPIIGGCFINEQGQHDCSQRQPPICVCNSGFTRNPTTNKCDVPSLEATRVRRESKAKLPDCGENAHILPIIGGCYINKDGQHDCSHRHAPICVCNSGFIRNVSTKKCDVPSLGAAPSPGDSKEKLPDCGQNESILPIIGGCFVNDKGEHDCSQRHPPICVCNSGFTRNQATNKCDVPSLGTA